LILIGALIPPGDDLLPTFSSSPPERCLLTAAHQMFEAVRYPLVAIPFFILTGERMNSSVVTQRDPELSRAIRPTARRPRAVNVVSSMLCGHERVGGSRHRGSARCSSPMKRSGYSPEFSAALTAVSD
jgi:TRAP-type C4-dicarboxylate transport system permease large subunit